MKHPLFLIANILFIIAIRAIFGFELMVFSGIVAILCELALIREFKS